MKQIDFSDKHIGKNMAASVIPLLAAQCVSLLYNIVDRIFIGRIEGIGTQALAGVGLCFPIITIVLAFTNLYGMGGGPLCAIKRGEKKVKEASDIMNTACFLLVFTGIALMILGEIFARPLLLLFGANQETLASGLIYLRIYLLGTVFSMISTGMNPYINAEGFPRVGMISVLIGAVLNLILDPVFIFIFGMGVSGAALATIISQAASAFFAIGFLRGKKTELRIRLISLAEFKEHADIAKNITSLGVAPFTMQLTNSLVTIVCNKMLAIYGGTIYVTVMTVVSSVRQIVDTPISSITEGSSPLISYNYGAKNTRLIRKVIFRMSLIAFLYTLIMWGLIELFPTFFIGLFTSDSAVMENGLTALHLYFFAFVFQSFQYSGQTVFKALNKKKRAIFFSIFRKVILVVPLTIILPHLLHPAVNGVFIAEPVSNVVGGLACFTTMLLTILPELKRMDDGE